MSVILDRHPCRHRSRAARHRRPCAAHADAAGAAAVGADRRRGLRQIRKSPGHQLVQGARRARQAGLAVGGRAGARRHRHVGRQPRPGGRLSRGEPRDRGDHRDAGDDAVREGGGHQGAWRAGGARRRDHQRGAGARRGRGARARPDLGASLRRSACHRRPGHRRARDAGGGARSRRAGDPDRRRRTDFRHRDGGESHQARDRDRRRGIGALSVDVERHPRRATGRSAARRSPKASR